MMGHRLDDSPLPAANRPTPKLAREATLTSDVFPRADQMRNDDQRGSAMHSSESATSSSTRTSTPMTSISNVDHEAKLSHLDRYISLGCLHLDQAIPVDGLANPEWSELMFSSLPDEIKQVIGNEASRLLEASWIRLFVHRRPGVPSERNGRIVRVYLLPEDWGRRFIDRRSKSLKLALRELLSQIDIAPEAWSGDNSNAGIRQFDPWASSEDVSLFYLFNKLPSPAPSAEQVKNRYSRNAVWGLLEAASSFAEGDVEVAPIPGLRSRLYPYQARSAALMIQREAAPQLQLDPRLEVRRSPTGETFYFGGRDGTFLKEPKFYETNRGGILAETMGLGKTIICLAMILATKGHMPQIPAAYQPPAPVRSGVGSLANMAACIIGRKGIPGKVYLEHIEASDAVDLGNCKQFLQRNVPHYEIPFELPRMNRTTKVPPPKQLVMCGSTIVVVPRNLLHQWQAEIRKHVVKGGLNILVMDSISKRASKARTWPSDDDTMELRSDLPPPTELMKYDMILFTRNRFEQEIQDGADEKGRRLMSGVPLKCECPYIGATRIPDCHCFIEGGLYESPLKKLHWLRIIIDEGHNFSSGLSNAVLVAKQIQAERRWVVSGTPAKNLVGVEVDLSTLDQEGTDPELLRELAIEQRKSFSLDDDNTKAAKALGSLASNFLMVRPWSESTSEGKLEWDDYMYRHEHHYRKTYTGFSSCFLHTLEGLVVKTRPEDVEKDIRLPPMRHRTVYLKPCWYDKMTANLFVQVLRANAVTSERADVDYLFHKNSVQARHILIRNLRQSNFTWTGFSLEDVASTLETSRRYLGKEDKSCSVEDANSLLESCRGVSSLLTSNGWVALSKAHEVGMAVENWPQDSEASFALAYPQQPCMIGITQLLDGQAHVDSQILFEQPADGLQTVGEAAKSKLHAIAEAESALKMRQQKDVGDAHLQKAGVPSSCVGGQSLTSRRTSVLPPKASKKTEASPTKKTGQAPKALSQQSSEPPSPSTGMDTSFKEVNGIEQNQDLRTPDEPATASPIRPKKRRLTLADEVAELPYHSSLKQSRIVGTTSAKLTYLIDMVMKHQATEKIIIFYDGNDAAYYIAQCLEMLYVNHRIYARTLDNTKRSQYVALFNEDPDVRVLLIDVACGALGLNLNVASVVLIVNPINRPGIEAQAIKRAHRIGQTKEVLVETLVLEGTIEEAIFKRAKHMSRTEHQEAKTLEDDNQIVDIIQNAEVLPVDADECQGSAQFALLRTPQQVFGRPGRDKYHRFGQAEAKSPEKSKKRARTSTKTPTTQNITIPLPAAAPLPLRPGSDTVPSLHPQSSLFGGASSS